MKNDNKLDKSIFLVLCKSVIKDSNNRNMVLLGDWCQVDRISDQPTFNTIYKWDDPKEYKKALGVVVESYEYTLKLLTELLNIYHKLDYSIKFWRILIGPWLYRFLSWTYDKYAHLEKAISLYGDKLYTSVQNNKDFIVPFDTNSFRNLCENDYYNYQLLSDIAEYWGIKHDETESINKFLNRYYSIYLKAFNQKMNKNIQVDITDIIHNISQSDVCIMTINEVKLDTKVVLDKSIYTCTPGTPWSNGFYVKNKEKKNIQTVSTRRSFQDFIQKNITDYIPLLYTEKFHLLQNLNDHIPNYPSLFISDNWHQNELIKFIAAMVSENKGKVVAINVGDMAGIIQYEFVEKHEKAISDYSVGRSAWMYGDYIWPDKHIRFIRNINPKNILFVSTGFELPYISDFHSFPAGVYQIDKYFKLQVSFFEKLDDKEKGLYIYRPHPYRNDMGHTEKIQKLGIQISNNTSLYEDMQQVKLIIFDHITTAIYSALKADIPFICSFDKKCWELTKDAEELLDSLEKVNMYHNTLTDTLNFVRKSNLDICEWWNDKNNKIVREKMKYFFYTEEENPEKTICNTIAKILQL